MSQKQAIKQNLWLGALGVVYGDIGTSPLYAFRQSLSVFNLPANEFNVLGILSLIFWTLTIVVSIKYVIFVMRADNDGEGGTLALWALVTERLKNHKKALGLSLLFGLLGTALFFGDCVITPAISVISAIEGLEIVTPIFKPIVVPLTICILAGLFVIQKHGTARMGAYFGPILAIWFVIIGLLGGVQIIKQPGVLLALNPHYAMVFLLHHGIGALLVLGAVMLCITGAEALYADMGHFGRKAIRSGWFILVFPSLILNYFGQGAYVLMHPGVEGNPFFEMVPHVFLVPMVIFSAVATVIASQAVISGAFSIAKQAIQLGFLPRLMVVHTSEDQTGQIFLPFVNWTLFMATVALVIGFGSSDAMGAAYGIAVSGTMLGTTLLLILLAHHVWHWTFLKITLIVAPLAAFDALLLTANSLKIVSGGWLPLLIAAGVLLIMFTWRKGRQLQRASTLLAEVDLTAFLSTLTTSDAPPRVPGVAVYLTGSADSVPHAMLHNLKHNKVLHQTVAVLTIVNQKVPYVKEADRVKIEALSHGFYRITGSFGFMDRIDIPAFVALCQQKNLPGSKSDLSYFLSRQRVIPTPGAGMALWREQLYAAMVVNSANATDFFRLPQNQVIELGSRVEI